MKIVEDKEDRERLFVGLTEGRFTVRAKAYEASPKTGWPRKHQLWPCVRLGAGTTWLGGGLHNEEWKPGIAKRRRALNFLRGHSHEAMMTSNPSLVFVYRGVGNEVDEWTGDPEAPFTEIKSTVISSARMWPIVQRGEVNILSPYADSFFQGYFEQSCQNAVATGVDRCRLRIFFMNGDYALRRKKCPECSKPLEEMKDIYKECLTCGYKSYSIDMRSYILTFTTEERAYYRREVFKTRRDQFHAAIESTSKTELKVHAPPTSCFLCKECSVGEELGCEKFGGKK